MVRGRRSEGRLEALAHHLSDDPHLLHLQSPNPPSPCAAARSEGVVPPSDDSRLPQLPLAEVDRHRTRHSCWVVLWDKVYDFTEFVGAHPGGARAILRNAGGDATATFQELHSDAIFHAFAGKYLIGIVPETERRFIPAPLPPTTDAVASLPSTDSLTLGSPFPHGRFDGTGLESVRFTWADADLSRGYFAKGRSSSPSTADLAHVHRQKSGLSPLAEQNWLALGSPQEYAQHMRLKKKLLSHDSAAAHMCYISEPSAVEAEREVLHEVLAYVATHHPDRFSIDLSTGVVQTTTPGYEHRFALSDYYEDPLRLVAQLVQEDFFLLVEEDSVWDPEGPKYAAELSGSPAQRERNAPDGDDKSDRQRFHSTAGGAEDTTKDRAWLPQSAEEWLEMHPSGKQHIFNSAASCFSFDPRCCH